MPLVISHAAKQVAHVDNLALLSIILGGSEFKVRGWALGDEIAFEDGRASTVVRATDKGYYVWSDPVQMEPAAFAALIFKYLKPGPWDAVKPRDFKALFNSIREDARSKPLSPQFILSIAIVMAGVFTIILVTVGDPGEFFMIQILPRLTIWLLFGVFVAVTLHQRSKSQDEPWPVKATSESRLLELDRLRVEGQLTAEEYQFYRQRITDSV